MHISCVSRQVPDLALRCGLGHDLADLLLPSSRVLVVLVAHDEFLEPCLPGEEDEQWINASIPIIFKPSILLDYLEGLKPVDMIIGEHLQEIVAVFCTAMRVLDVQSVEAAAVGDGLTCEL